MSTEISSPPVPAAAHVSLKILVAAAGVLIVTAGLGGATIYLISLITTLEDFTLDNSVAMASVAGLCLGLGGLVIWQSGRSIFGKASARFLPPVVWWLIPIYGVVLVLGQIIITFDFFPTVAFPPFHILAAALPPLAIIIIAGRILNRAGLRWRSVILQLASGAFFSTFLAFVAEMIIGFSLLIGIAIITALTPAGRQYLTELMDNVQNPLWLQNPANMQELLLFPPISITIGLIFIVIAPLLEEVFKLFGVMVMSYRRPSRAQIFIWGLAGGAGFALTENLFNTVLALDVWAFIMLLRIGGTAMHSLGTALIALGWHQWLCERRLGRLLGMYGLSVLIHALWNGAVIGMTAISVLAAGSTNELVLGMVGITIVALLVGLLILTLALLAIIVIVSQRLSRELTAE